MSHLRPAALCLLALGLAACGVTREHPDVVTISVVGTNDVHGALTPGAEVGGLVMLSAYVDALRLARETDGGAVVLIDAGDMWQGTLESNLVEGAAMVDAYNAMGVDAAAIGNHEFDFGPEGPNAIPIEDGDDPRGNLKQRARQASFPMLAANLIDVGTNQSVDWENVQPSIMLDIAGIKIGVIGVMTTQALVTTIAANVEGLRIAPLAETISAQAQRLRGDGATLVIVASHAGGRCTEFSSPEDLSSCDLSAEIMQVARELEPGLVDYIVAGHKHFPIAHLVNGIAITSNPSNAYSFGRVDFRIDSESQRVISRQVFSPQRTAAAAGNTSYEGQPLVVNADVQLVADRAAARAEALKQEKLGVILAADFDLKHDSESPLANLMTQAMLESFDVDVAIHNVIGGIRSNLPAGELTYGAVFRMFPFDNIVTLHDVSGRDLRQVIASHAHVRRKPGFAGMRVFVSCEGEQMNIDMRLRDGRVISDDDIVRVVANDFLALGGDGILTPAFRGEDFEIRYDMPLTREALVDWFRAGPEHLAPADFVSSSAPKWNLPDPMPDTCQY